MPVKHFSTIAECEAELARLRQICIDCPGPSLNPSGGNVHFDAYEDMEIAAKKIFSQIDPAYHPGERTDTRPAPGVSVEAWEVLARVLAEVAVLTDRQSVEFAHLLRGEVPDGCGELLRTRPEIAAILRAVGINDFTPPDGQNPDGPSGGQTTSGEIGRG